MSCANLPPGCTQEQLDAALGYEPEIELSEEELEAEYLEKILATAYLAPPNIFWECSTETAPRTLSAAERASIQQFVATLTVEDLDWVEQIAAAGWHRLMRADLERDERELVRKPAARVLINGRAA